MKKPVSSHRWNEIIPNWHLTDQRHLQSLVELLQDVGQLLGQYYRVDDDPSGNELPDQLIFLA